MDHRLRGKGDLKSLNEKAKEFHSRICKCKTYGEFTELKGDHEILLNRISARLNENIHFLTTKTERLKVEFKVEEKDTIYCTISRDNYRIHEKRGVEYLSTETTKVYVPVDFHENFSMWEIIKDTRERIEKWFESFEARKQGV